MGGSGAAKVRRCNLGHLSGVNVVLKGVTRTPLCVACECLCLSSGDGIFPSLLHICTAGAIQTLVLPLAINDDVGSSESCCTSHIWVC